MNVREMVQKPGVSLVPGAIYPDTVHVISTSLHGTGETSQENKPVQLSSVEPCCGTHVLNTGDIGAFVIERVVSS